MIDQIGKPGLAPADPGLQSEKLLAPVMAAARTEAVFGAPVVSGTYTVITASEVAAGGGFGFGGGTTPTPTDSQAPSGTSGSGGGGGGGSTGRPVAAIIIGPAGVEVRPILDPTKLILAVIAAWGSVAFLALRIARTRPRRRPTWVRR